MKKETWELINAAMKHLFDGLRNLGIAGTALAASIYDLKVHSSQTDNRWGEIGVIVSCLLLLAAFLHFAIGTFFVFPTAKSFQLKLPRGNPYTVQVCLISIYLVVAVLLLAFLSR